MSEGKLGIHCVREEEKGEGKGERDGRRRGKVLTSLQFVDWGKVMVEAGADINLHTQDLATPLIQTLAAGQSECAKWLIGLGAGIIFSPPSLFPFPLPFLLSLFPFLTLLLPYHAIPSSLATFLPLSSSLLTPLLPSLATFLSLSSFSLLTPLLPSPLLRSLFPFLYSSPPPCYPPLPGNLSLLFLFSSY